MHEKFKLQNIRNLPDKNIVAFVQPRQFDGIVAKTTKNDLSGIRFLHKKTEDVGSKGGRIFVAEHEKVHPVLNQLEKYLTRVRTKVETAEGRAQRSHRRKGNYEVNELTWHG